MRGPLSVGLGMSVKLEFVHYDFHMLKKMHDIWNWHEKVISLIFVLYVPLLLSKA